MSFIDAVINLANSFIAKKMLQTNSIRRKMGCGTVLENLSCRVNVVLADTLNGIRNIYVVSSTKLSSEIIKTPIEIQ